MRYVACLFLVSCVSYPVWSPDWRHADEHTTVTVSRVYYQQNGTTLTVTKPVDAGQ